MWFSVFSEIYEFEVFSQSFHFRLKQDIINELLGEDVMFARKTT
jgi:hypothetical protein